MDTDTAYKILNIKRSELSKELLKKKYYKACLKYHPDKNGSTHDFLKVTEAYEILQKELDNDVMKIIRKFIRTIFYLFHQIQYELTPTLSHLMKREVFYVKEYDIYIPLWHQEIIYYPVCFTISVQLPDNMYIDSDNNIHVFIGTETVFDVGGISFSISPTIKNIVELKGMGIPRINFINIYDVSCISDIIVHITSS